MVGGFAEIIVLASSEEGVQSQAARVSYLPPSFLSFSFCWCLFCLPSSRPHFCHARNGKTCASTFCEGGSGSFDLSKRLERDWKWLLEKPS